VIPAAFDYQRATSTEEALEALAQHGDEAKLLAGGHSLLPLMKLRLAAPAVLVDIGRLHELSYVREEGDEIAIGALTRHRDVEVSATLARDAPLLAQVAAQVGDPQVRHRGTLGGSLAHGDPASDLPSALLALGGSMVVQGPGGRRKIEAEDFFQGFFETALAPDEMLLEVRVPRQAGAGFGYEKFNRRAQDWAIVGVSAVRSAEGTRVGLVNMANAPIRARGVEAALAAGASLADAALHAADKTDPPSDVNASAEFRRHLVQVLTRRALESCSGFAA
jgi:carbon-monoxide dehydrogenase medium subunit